MKRLPLLLLLAAAACSDDPVDAEGTYSVALTKRDNGCNFQNWTAGDTTQNVTVVITQNGTAAIADVQGGAGAFLDFAFGSKTFSGSVDGDALDLKLSGNKPQTTGNCTYTYDGRITATLNGDALQGKLTTSSNGNNNTDCAAIACSSVQDLAGVRPPK